jgi:hypothetical protein
VNPSLLWWLVAGLMTAVTLVGAALAIAIYAFAGRLKPLAIMPAAFAALMLWWLWRYFIHPDMGARAYRPQVKGKQR